LRLASSRGAPVEIEALTEWLVLDERCTGVRYAVAGKVRKAPARRAVVVNAGAFNPPQLLKLSGIAHAQPRYRGAP
jgi:choline dehydrogenase-like flavoprotein